MNFVTRFKILPASSDVAALCNFLQLTPCWQRPKKRFGVHTCLSLGTTKNGLALSQNFMITVKVGYPAFFNGVSSLEQRVEFQTFLFLCWRLVGGGSVGSVTSFLLLLSFPYACLGSGRRAAGTSACVMFVFLVHKLACIVANSQDCRCRTQRMEAFVCIVMAALEFLLYWIDEASDAFV